MPFCVIVLCVPAVTFAPNAYVVQNFPLLVSAGACPSLTAVNPSVVTCPIGVFACRVCLSLPLYDLGRPSA